MNDDRFIKLCELLNLGNLISTPTKVTGGLLHLIWHIKTSKGDYAIKELNKHIVVNNKVKNSYEITEKISQRFFENGISAVTSLKFNNKSLVEVDDDIFIIYPWVDGITLNCDAIRYSHAEKLGAVLARMHMLNLLIPELLKPGWDINTNEYFRELTDRSVKANLSFSNILQENLSNIISWNNTYQENIPYLNNNLIISHGDLDQKNIIWTSNLTPMLIDWESARLLNPTQEIINAALDWSGVTSSEINLKIFETILLAYRKIGGKINKNHIRAALWAIVGNWLNWMRYNIMRSLGNHISSEEERRLGIKQVQVVLQTLMYLTTNIENLTNVVLQNEKN